MEDQHYNGDVWNKEAYNLLALFGWNKIGDYDMDISGDDNKKMGIDTIVRFETPLKTRPQLAILEAKRYQTTSFNRTCLQDWIEKLDRKLLKLRNSSEFKEQFPYVEECTVADLGIIVIWFSDTENYNNFHYKYLEMLRGISMSSRQRKAGVNKIYVLDNTFFMKLFALSDIINNEHLNNKIRFLYPSRFINNEPIAKSMVLTIEYIFSDIIFAEFKTQDNHTSYIFYFGQLNLPSLQLVYEAYANTSLYDKTIPVVLYVYNADDEFRKLEPCIENDIFKDFNITIKKMVANNSIPSYIINSVDNE